MNDREAIVTGLVRWWCRQEERDVSSWLSERFEYDSGFVGTSNREEFLSAHIGSGAITELRIVDVVCRADSAMIMFEGVDTVTNLRHRTCWALAFEGTQVATIRKCGCVLPRD